jgi:hypothetical protein
MATLEQREVKPAARAALPPARRRRSASSRGFLPLLGLMIGAVAFLPSTIVALVGAVPILAALMVDDTPRRYLFRTVAAMTVVALAPLIDRLWRGANDIPAAFGIVADAFTWLAIYGAAGAGWLMFIGCPALVSSYRVFAASQKAARLKREQERLLEEWGEALSDVAGATAAAKRAEGEGGPSAPSPARAKTP